MKLDVAALVVRRSICAIAAIAACASVFAQHAPRAIDMIDASSLELGDPAIEATAERWGS